MRRLLACTVLLALGAGGAAPAATAPPGWQPAIAAASRLARARRGTISFAVCTPQGCRGREMTRTFPCASLLKPMLLVGYLRRPGVADRPLSPQAKRELVPMIEQSDSPAATRIRAIVGSDGLRRVARAAHMQRFTPVVDPWGDSRVDALDQARFFLHVDQLLPARHRALAMLLLRHIVPAQRWGVAQAAPADWRLYFKGGWGSGTGRVDHQSALLVRGDQRVAVSILTAGDGSHAYGKQTLELLARRLLAGLSVSWRAGRAKHVDSVAVMQPRSTGFQPVKAPSALAKS